VRVWRPPAALFSNSASVSLFGAVIPFGVVAIVCEASQDTPAIGWPEASRLAKWISTGYTLAT
jgi:hypothetical protein